MTQFFEDNEEFMTVEELAEVLKVSQRTIQRIVRRKELPAVKIGRQFRFRKKWINEWLQENTITREGNESA